MSYIIGMVVIGMVVGVTIKGPMVVLTILEVGTAPGTMVPSVGMTDAMVGGRVMAGAKVTRV